MGLKLASSDISAVKAGSTDADKVYLGSTLVWQRGVAFTDPLDSLTNFTQTYSGSGIACSGGEALWNGTTDGYGSALFNTSPKTTDRYVAIVAGSTLQSSRYSGAYLCTDASLSRGYAVSFSTSTVYLKQYTGAGNWYTATNTDLTSASATVAAGTLIEMWNIGTTCYIAVAGVVKITYTLNATYLAASYDKQGIGLYRSTFVSSSRIAEFRGGDASAYGKAV